MENDSLLVEEEEEINPTPTLTEDQGYEIQSVSDLFSESETDNESPVVTSVVHEKRGEERGDTNNFSCPTCPARLPHTAYVNNNTELAYNTDDGETTDGVSNEEEENSITEIIQGLGVLRIPNIASDDDSSYGSMPGLIARNYDSDSSEDEST